MSSKAIGEAKVPGSRALDVLIDPGIGETESIVKEAISHGKTLLLAGSFSVNYLGRAKSKLELGERILIVKADGSLLVHRSVGYEPVNWMPGGDVVFDVRVKGAVLEIRAARRKPVETVTVLFDDVQLVASLSLSDSGEFSLHASEADMQRAILTRPDLLEEGFKPIAFERRVEPGFVDVYGEDSAGKLVVVEIKRKTAGKEAVFQLARYVEGIRARSNRPVRGVLVAPYIGRGVQRAIMTLGLEYKPLDPKRCVDVLSRVETGKLVDFFKER